jgi:hypothetical protein
VLLEIQVLLELTVSMVQQGLRVLLGLLEQMVLMEQQA